MRYRRIGIVLSALALAAGVGDVSAAHARDRVSIVGSSTVYPFSTAVAEQVGKQGRAKTPVVESTGTGGGFKLFCQGVGERYPDFSNASRAMKKSEFALCKRNGVTSITEVMIGYDGITLAHKKGGRTVNMSLHMMFRALAKEVPDDQGNLMANPHKKWSDINPGLPSVKIEVLGPPPTSGTRDAFVELAMQVGCSQIRPLDALKKSDKRRYDTVCSAMRADGAFVEAGENDNVIVQKLIANPNAFGLFGFSFLSENSDKLQGVHVAKEAGVIAFVEPSFESIANGSYALSRPIFFYVKDQHVGVIPGKREYIAEFTSLRSMGPNGYLARHGLIPLPQDVYDQMVRRIIERTSLDGSTLK